MGQNAKPIQLHIAAGNPNRLTKSEIERRQAAEIKFGEHRLTCPAYVKRDVVAFAKWKEIARLYKDVDFVASGDLGLIGRYCQTWSEYQNLIRCREQINRTDFDYNEEVEEALEEKYGERQAAKLFQKIEFILSVGGLITIDTAINKKMDMLIKMEDRMFLNPLAKLKNIPKKEKQKADENADLFD